MSDTNWSESLLEDLAAGRRRVCRSGRVVPYRLDGDDRLRFKRAKRVGFLVGGGRPNAENCYRIWCYLHPRPLITVRPGRRYSDVFLSMTYVGWQLDRLAVQEVDVLRYLWAAETRGGDRQSAGLADDCLVNFDMIRGVGNRDAETVAFRLWEVALDCRPDGNDPSKGRGLPRWGTCDCPC